MPRKTALRGLPAAPPMPSTSCFSHRKLSADTAVPINHPAPHHQPRQASSATAPPAPIAQISFQMRATARSIHNSSAVAGSLSPVIACVPHELPDELHEPGGNPQDQPRDKEPGSPEFLVQQVSESIAEQSRHGHHERQRRVFAYHHRPRFLRHTYSLLRGALRRLSYQKAHLRMGRLHHGMDAELLESFRSGRSDGTYQAAAQIAECGVLDSEFAGRSEERRVG